MTFVGLGASPTRVLLVTALALLLLVLGATAASARLSSWPDDFPVGVEIRFPGDEHMGTSYIEDIELSADGKVAYAIGKFNRAFDKGGSYDRPGFVAVDLVNQRVLPQRVDLLCPSGGCEPFVIKRQEGWLYNSASPQRLTGRYHVISFDCGDGASSSWGPEPYMGVTTLAYSKLMHKLVAGGYLNTAGGHPIPGRIALFSDSASPLH